MISLMLLAVESNTVVALRTMRFFSGHPDSLHEAQLMVSEKASAAVEASVNLLTGASLDSVVHRYREHVAANTARLTN